MDNNGQQSAVLHASLMPFFIKSLTCGWGVGSMAMIPESAVAINQSNILNQVSEGVKSLFCNPPKWCPFASFISLLIWGSTRHFRRKSSTHKSLFLLKLSYLPSMKVVNKKFLIRMRTYCTPIAGYAGWVKTRATTVMSMIWQMCRPLFRGCGKIWPCGVRPPGNGGESSGG